MKKYYYFVLFCLWLLSGCMPGQVLDVNPMNRLNKINKPEYILTYPADMPAAELDLIFLISPGGSAREAELLLEHWRPYIFEHKLALAAAVDWGQESLNNALHSFDADYGFGRIFVSGFSNGGYNSCRLGFSNPELVSGIIPMGAFCSLRDYERGKQPLPVLVVVGENDTWARGDDLKMIEEKNRELKQAGVNQEQLIVPNLGHKYPGTALEQVLDWIKSQ